VTGHFGNGIAIAIIYAALVPSLFGPNWARGLSFATVQTIMNVWLLLYPLLGLSIAGLEAGCAPAVISLVRHYFFILPAIFLLRVDTGEEAGQSPVSRAAGISTVSTLLIAITLIFSGQDVSASSPNTQVSHKTVQVNGVEVFYRQAGTVGNPTLLLLHGFPTSSHMFRNLLRDLGDDYYLVAPDYPGFGNSEQPSMEEFDYSFDNLAHLLEGFTEALELDRYRIYLMDYAAPIGFRLAAKYPERVDTLIIQNGNAYEEGLREFWDPIRVYWKEPTAENAAPLAGFISPEGVKWQYTHGVRNPDTISPDNWNVDLRHLTREGNPQIQLKLFHSYQTNVPLYPEWQQYFREHQPPALIVWGKNDYIFPAEGAHPYKQDLETLEFHLLDTGHFALEEDGAVITQRIREFLTRHVVHPVAAK
jgi:pimeloyl-ACP methyl ester carboxylesterase